MSNPNLLERCYLNNLISALSSHALFLITHPYIDIIKDECATWFDFHDDEYGEIYGAYDSEVPPGRCSLCGNCKNPDYPNCISMCEIIANL